MIIEKLANKFQSISLFLHIFLPSVLMLGIFVFLEIISYNHNQAFDLTPENKYTLSLQTKSVLDSLDDQLYLRTFYDTNDKETVNVFYKKLSDYSSKIKYELIDLDWNPGKARLYNASRPGYTIVEYKEKIYTVPAPSEETIVNAILSLTASRQKVFYILKGHGERDDIELFKKALALENWMVHEIYLTDLPTVSHKDIAVLMIAGIDFDLSETEISVLQNYLDAGGKVIILVEPFIKIPNMIAFCSKYGIELPDEIIIDQKNKLIGGDSLAPLIYSAQFPFDYQANIPSLFLTARPIGIKNTGSPTGASVEILAESAKHSWTQKKRDDALKGRIEYIDGVDRVGPIPVAALSTLPKGSGVDGDKKGKLLCFGDSDFIGDALIGSMGNRDFFLNTVEWLAKDYNLISIRQKEVRYPYPFLNQQQAGTLFITTVIFLPSLFLLISALIFVYRRIRG